MAAAPTEGLGGDEAEVSDLGPLNVVWDQNPNLRQRVRTLGRILLEKPENEVAPKATTSPLTKTLENMKYNSEALKPLVEAMANHKGVPAIPALAEQIAKLFSSQGMTASPKVLSDQSWSFRYLFQLLKSLRKRSNPPKAICFKYVSCKLFSFFNFLVPIQKCQDPIYLELLTAYGVDIEHWRKDCKFGGPFFNKHWNFVCVPGRKTSPRLLIPRP